MSQVDLYALIRNIPDFPIPGIQFKDITPLLQDGAAFAQVVDTFKERYAAQRIDAIVGIESRGFIFGASLAYTLGIGLVPVRKPGKLPAATHAASYELEYGSNTLEIHQDALQPGMRVVVMDDLLATGGTIGASCQLVEQLGAEIVELAFLIELDFLKGRDSLQQYAIFSLLHF
jgi:adenine phosphoribosyltransferase